jgi:hypothetical protein
MDAVESVKNDKKLFDEVYQLNPYCKDTLDHFNNSVKLTMKQLTSEPEININNNKYYWNILWDKKIDLIEQKI